MANKSGSCPNGNRKGSWIYVHQNFLLNILRTIVLLGVLILGRCAIETKVTEPWVYIFLLGVASYAALSASKFGQNSGKK